MFLFNGYFPLALKKTCPDENTKTATNAQLLILSEESCITDPLNISGEYCENPQWTYSPINRYIAAIVVAVSGAY